MQAMRSTQIKVERKERLRRLNKSLLSSAVPVPAKKKQGQQRDGRVLGYYNDDANQNYDEYGFDMSSYSLKYAGCSAIATYSDELADDEDSETVFESDQYVVFRFCPTDYCSDSSTRGCMDNYGEYMVPIATWLETMVEFREEELERYCEYCENCYGNDGNDNNNNNGNYGGYYRRLEDNADGNANDDGNANGDDGNNNNNANDDGNANNANDDGNANNANDDGNANNANDDGANNNNNGNNCSYENQCSGYADVCNNDEGGIDHSKFVECKELDWSDDLVLYIGPKCESDKSTIILGVFKDQYCTQYVGKNYDLATLTNQMLTEEFFDDYYSTECISCKEGVSQLHIWNPIFFLHASILASN